MLGDVLNHLGLSDKERETYLLLLGFSSSTPAQIAEKISVPRTTAQNILIRLDRKGLAQQVKQGKGIRYEAVHPEVLRHLLSVQKKQTLEKFDKVEEQYEKFLPELLGMLHSNKSIPQVRFFRGLEGARTVLFDTLTSKTELKDFANIDAMFNVFKEVNDEYVARREKTSVTKRSILLDTPFARNVYESGAYSPKSHKGYKWIPQKAYHFSIEMNIYDGKISYLTYVQEELIGVIIENPYIFETHHALWNLLWDLLPETTNSARERETVGV